MKTKLGLWSLSCFLLTVSTLLAQPGKDDLEIPASIPKPLVSGDGEKFFRPPQNTYNPDLPVLGPEGTFLHLTESIQAPDSSLMDPLSNNDALSEIQRLTRTENQPDHFYWTPTGDAHYVDFQGEHWYGLNSPEAFYWVFWKNGRFWWNDTYAHRWLYYYAGFWWYPNPQSPRTVQLYWDENYYPFDSQGNVAWDSGGPPTTIISGKGPFQGDHPSHSGHRHGGQNGFSGAFAMSSPAASTMP